MAAPTVKHTINLSPELTERAQAYATVHGMKLVDVIRQSMTEFLDRAQKPTKERAR